MDVDTVGYTLVGEFRVSVLPQILSEGLLLCLHPGERKAYRKDQVCLVHAAVIQFLRNRRKGQDIKVLILRFVVEIRQMAFADGIRNAVIAQDVVIGDSLACDLVHTGQKYPVRRLDVAIAVVDA